MITVFKKTFTPTEIKNGQSTPILIIPAPASGYVRNIFGGTERFVPGSVAYDGVTESALIYNIADYMPWALGFIFDNQSVAYSRCFQLTSGGGPLFSTEDPIYWMTNGDSTVGDGEYTVFLVYEDKLITVS